MSDERPHLEDQDFKWKVLETLTEVKTDVKSLIGGDGREGRVPALEKDVKSINKKIYLASGALIGIDGLLKFLSTFAGKFVGKH